MYPGYTRNRSNQGYPRSIDANADAGNGKFQDRCRMSQYAARGEAYGSTCASTIRSRYAFALRRGACQAASVASSLLVIADTCDAEMRSPHRVSTIGLTFRVFTPWMYFSTSAGSLY